MKLVQHSFSLLAEGRHYHAIPILELMVSIQTESARRRDLCPGVKLQKGMSPWILLQLFCKLQEYVIVNRRPENTHAPHHTDTRPARRFIT